jgi:hypothetical protein
MTMNSKRSTLLHALVLVKTKGTSNYLVLQQDTFFFFGFFVWPFSTLSSLGAKAKPKFGKKIQNLF